ncbi:MAG: 2Fe-2S iron-sulfur cluster binding domain-containing protein [Alphaproteobacteria bacterium]|nr:2Fe-2S iron-sulfur cluster binding domain-containing protein [Alphaproteobacteria bacterium]
MAFHDLKIADVRRETADCVSIALHVPPDLADAYRFTPGQHLTLKLEIGGKEERRSYSICAAPAEKELRVAIKRVPDGAFSNFANSKLAVGDRVAVGTPEGRFGIAPDPRAARTHVLVAAGSGITPVISIAKALLGGEPGSHVVLVYANRTVDSIIFREALEDLKNRHMERFSLVHVLSRERQDTPLLDGRLDGTKMAALATALFDVTTVDGYYLCGPHALVETVRTALVGLGAPESRVHTELFLAPDAATARVTPESGAVHREGTARVTVIRDGIRQVFEVGYDGPSILDAGIAKGLELPFSCKGGVCSTCRCLKRAGEVEMAANYSLEPWELEKGFVLACQSRPTSTEVVLDFDEA